MSSLIILKTESLLQSAAFHLCAVRQKMREQPSVYEEWKCEHYFYFFIAEIKIKKQSSQKTAALNKTVAVGNPLQRKHANRKLAGKNQSYAKGEYADHMHSSGN